MRPHFILPDRMTSTATFLPSANQPEIIYQPCWLLAQRLLQGGGCVSGAAWGRAASLEVVRCLSPRLAPCPLPSRTPAGQETGTSAGGTSTGGTGGSGIWQIVAKLLITIDPDVRCYVQRLFERTLEAAEDDLALPPEQRRLMPVPFLAQHLGRPRFQRVIWCEQDQKGIDRLLRQALWRAIDALGAAALLPEREVYLTLLAEQCRQFVWVYEGLKRRVGKCVALWIAQGELRLLHHRGSRVAEEILFS